MLDGTGVEDKLFARWGNRCPVDAGFLSLEYDGPGFIPVLKCGWMHHMTLEHFVGAMDQIPLSQAQSKLAAMFGPTYEPHWDPFHVWFKAEPLTPLQPFDFQPGASDYWTGRGFSPEDQVKYGLGLVNGLPGVTYTEDDGTIFGWIQRLPEVPENEKVVELGKKYKYVDKNSKRRLWGVPHAKALMIAKGISWVVVTEGCVDAVRFLQAGIPAVALNQPSFTKSHLVELHKLSLCPIICSDNDAAGRNILHNGVAGAFLPVFFQATLWHVSKKDPACCSPHKLLAEFKSAFPEAGV